MSVLILTHVPYEGPGAIGTFLREHRIPFRVIECLSEEIPDIESFDSLVIMGGPMSVNDGDSSPFLKTEIELAGKSIRNGKKVFGVCLGAQIMAKALGARVYRNPSEEIGWFDIELLSGGKPDPLMRTLFWSPDTGESPPRTKVFHWHGETFDIPEGAVHLASSMACGNQAFSVGPYAYGFQFHIEVDRHLLNGWKTVLPPHIDISPEKGYFEEYSRRANDFFRKFFLAA